MPLTETEILDRHGQALKEARAVCTKLSLNADPEYLAPRGRLYTELREAVDRLEGSARQMAAFREDARWIKLGMFYAKVRRAAQKVFVGQRWAEFATMAQIFERGLVSQAELKDTRTGVVGAVLPKRPSSWIIMPDGDPITRPRPPMRFLN